MHWMLSIYRCLSGTLNTWTLLTQLSFTPKFSTKIFLLPIKENQQNPQSYDLLKQNRIEY